MKNIVKITACTAFTLLIVACSTKKDSFVSRKYHSISTEYNVLYNGQLALEDGLTALNANYEDNYWEVLPIEPLKVDELAMPGMRGDADKSPQEFERAEEKAVKASVGRFGPYIQHNSKFYSLTKEDDPYEVTLDRAIELIHIKRKADAERLIKTFTEDDTLQVLNGRFGPYIAQGKTNFKIPKGTDPAALTYEEVVDIMSKQPVKAKAKGRAKK